MSKRFAPPPTRYGQPPANPPQPAVPPSPLQPKAIRPVAAAIPPGHPVAAGPPPASWTPTTARPPGFAAPTALRPAVGIAVQPKSATPPVRHSPAVALRPMTMPPRPAGGPVIQRVQQSINLGYESYAEDSGDELEDIGARPGKRGIKETRVYKQYLESRQILRDRFKASQGFTVAGQREKMRATKKTKMNSAILAEIVGRFETGEAGANTHIMVQDKHNTTLFQANTATAVKLAIGKLKHGKSRVKVRQAAARALKMKNVHTEMYVLHQATHGKVKDVPNALFGQKVVVDKPCCKMCYYWMKKAGATVMDGTSFLGVTGDHRAAYKWTDPFTGKSYSASELENFSEAVLQAYVDNAVA